MSVPLSGTPLADRIEEAFAPLEEMGKDIPEMDRGRDLLRSIITKHWRRVMVAETQDNREAARSAYGDFCRWIDNTADALARIDAEAAR